MIAFPLAVGVTDPPIIALTCLVLAWAGRGKLVRAGLALARRLRDEVHGLGGRPGARGHGVGSVRAARRGAVHRHRRGRDRHPGAARGAGGAGHAADVKAVKQNLIDYPLGLTKYKTLAASPLPGHLIAGLGTVGH